MKVLLSFFVFIFTAVFSVFSQNRVLVNPSFEHPGTPTIHHGEMAFVNAANSSDPKIQGWNTTASDDQIEIWHDGKDGFKAHAGLGKQWAELNANFISRLYENVCLIKGEVISWTYFHRGRGSSTIPDEMELNIYSQAGVKVATLQKASTTNVDWKEYSGSYKIDFPTGVYQLSFEAIRTGSGNSTEGNFIDGATIHLSPLLQFSSDNFGGFESSSKNVPTLTVNGTIPHGGSEVTLVVEGGSAILREDYLFSGSFTIPAGSYSPQHPYTIPMSIMNDNIPENNETINLKIVSAGNGTKITDADCDGIVYTTAKYTIIDDDTAGRGPSVAFFNNKKISASDTVNLNILFEQGTDIISKSSEGELTELEKFMSKNAGVEIELEGHTERDEPSYTKRQRELNLILSEKRVKKIKNYLIGQGINGARIKTKAYGGTQPVSDDPAKNRRVVMRILKL